MAVFSDLFKHLVDIAPGGGPRQVTSGLTWTEATTDVQAAAGMTATSGQQSGRPSPLATTGTADLTLRNDASGGKTPGRWSGLGLYAPIRWRVRYPLTTPGNLLSAEAASFEGGTDGGWSGLGGCTVANDSTRAQVGTKALLVTWTAGIAGSQNALVTIAGLTIGRTYTVSMYAYVPVGHPSVNATCFFVVAGSTMSTTGAFTRMSVTFTATAGSHLIGVSNASTATAGQQCWIDAVMVDEGSTVGTFTTSAPPIFNLWRGHVTEWGVGWDGAGRALAKVSASDLLANLNRTTLGRLVAEEILSDAPVAYWPLGEDSTAGAAGDLSATTSAPSLVPTQLGSGGSIAFGVGKAPGPDTATLCALTRSNATNGWRMIASSAPYANQFGFTLEAFIRPSAAALAGCIVVQSTNLGANGDTRIAIDGSGHAQSTVNLSSELIFSTIVGTSVLSTTALTHVAMTESIVSTTVTQTLYVNGVAEATTTYTRAAGAPVPLGLNMYVGGGLNGELFDGQISDVAIFPTALSAGAILRHAQAGLTGFAGETSDLRFDRIARLGDLPTDRYTSPGTGLSTMCAQPTLGVKLPDALKTVGEAEFGTVTVDAQGRISFQERSRRYNATAALTLDARTQLLNDTATLAFNDSDLINSATFTRPGGATQRSVNQASLNTYGEMTDTRTIYVADDTQLASASQWAANVRAQPAYRSPTLKVSMMVLHNAGLATAALGLAQGALVTVTNLPAGGPSSASFFVEGLAWDGSNGADLTLSIYTSPAQSSSVWQLDSATYSQLDSTTVLAF